MSLKLVVFRAIQSGPKQGTEKSEWLKGDTSRDDVVSEAHALLSDPKDHIVAVKVWHEGWGQFLPLTFTEGWAHDGSHKLIEGEVDRV